MSEPYLLPFPGLVAAPRAAIETSDVPIAFRPLAADPDLQALLRAWNEATDRLQQTHETLRAEVGRLTDELEAKNRELAHKERLADLGQMASHIAHEVRNSLVPMKLYLSLLRRRISDDSGSVDVLDKVTSGFTALEATVGDLLHFSSDRQPQRTRFPLLHLIEEVCEALEPQLDAQEIQAQIDCDADLVLFADREMLRRAILNLFLNALDVMPGGGELLVTACKTSGRIEIEVADSGPGIPDDALDHLFEPFFTTKSSGTGLGLAIVERIVAAHGGKIVPLNCPEGGAAFTLVIPSSTRALEKAA